MANAENARFENKAGSEAWREAREGVLRDSQKPLRKLLTDLAPGVEAQETFAEADQRSALARLVERFGSVDLKASRLGKILKNPSFVGMAGFMVQDAIQSLKEIRDLPKLRQNIEGLRQMLERVRKTASDETTQREVRMGEEYLSQLSLLCFGKQSSTIAFAADAAGDAIEMAHGGRQMLTNGARGLGKAGELIGKLEGSLKLGSKLELSIPYLYAGATVVQNLAIAQSGRVERQKIEQVQEYVRSYMEQYLSPEERQELARELVHRKEEMSAMKDAEMASTLVFFVITCLNPWLGIGVGLGAGTTLLAPAQGADAWRYDLKKSAMALAAGLRLHETQAEDYLWQWSTEYEKTPLYQANGNRIIPDDFGRIPESTTALFDRANREDEALLLAGRMKVVRAYLINGYRIWLKETKKEGSREEMQRYLDAGMGWFRDNRSDYRATSRADARECLDNANVRAKEAFATAKTLANLHGLGFELEQETDPRTRIYRWRDYRIRVSFRDGNSWTKPDWTAIDAAGKPIPVPAEAKGQIETGLQQVWLRLKYDGVKLRIRRETPGMKDIYADEFRYSEWKGKQSGYWNIVRFGEVDGQLKAVKFFIDRSMSRIMEYGSVEGIPFSPDLFVTAVDDSGKPKTNVVIMAEIRDAAKERPSEGPAIVESPTHMDAYFRIGPEIYRAWFARDSEAHGIERVGNVNDMTLPVGLPKVSAKSIRRREAATNTSSAEGPMERGRRLDYEKRRGEWLFRSGKHPKDDGPQPLGRP